MTIKNIIKDFHSKEKVIQDVPYIKTEQGYSMLDETQQKVQKLLKRMEEQRITTIHFSQANNKNKLEDTQKKRKPSKKVSQKTFELEPQLALALKAVTVRWVKQDYTFKGNVCYTGEVIKKDTNNRIANFAIYRENAHIYSSKDKGYYGFNINTGDRALIGPYRTLVDIKSALLSTLFTADLEDNTYNLRPELIGKHFKKARPSKSKEQQPNQ